MRLAHLDIETASPGCLKKEKSADAFTVAEFKLFFECRPDIPDRRDGTRDGMTCLEFDRHLFLFFFGLVFFVNEQSLET